MKNNKTEAVKMRVAAVSSGPNAFGLWGHVLMTAKGELWEVARSRGEWMGTSWARGTEIEVPLDANGHLVWAQVGAEIPRRLPDAPLAVVAEVWKS
jgi:hypothetical protein